MRHELLTYSDKSGKNRDKLCKTKIIELKIGEVGPVFWLLHGSLTPISCDFLDVMIALKAGCGTEG
jgi:hypothetical protein